MDRSSAHSFLQNVIRIMRRLFGLVRVHRRTVTIQMLRGACYGVGTSAVSILAVWAQRHL